MESYTALSCSPLNCQCCCKWWEFLEERQRRQSTGSFKLWSLQTFCSTQPLPLRGYLNVCLERSCGSQLCLEDVYRAITQSLLRLQSILCPMFQSCSFPSLRLGNWKFQWKKSSWLPLSLALVSCKLTQPNDQSLSIWEFLTSVKCLYFEYHSISL